jgi:ribosomal protein S18 acetylase RimI-like enzyme
MTVSSTVPVREVPWRQLTDAAQLAARAMHDNPLHVAALGSDVDRRIAVMRSALGHVLRAGGRTVLGAWEGDRLLGIAAFAPVGRCRPTSTERIATVPVVVRAGRSARHLLAWQRAWSQLDPDEPHVHLGPVAVVSERRGAGIGGRLLSECVTHLDREQAVGYLETDKEVNVAFYERFGFRVVERRAVIGVPNWFMLREPGAAPGRAGPSRR